MVITRAKNKSPDMILTPFDVKFHEKKDELPPKACRPPKKLRKTMGESGPSRSRKKQCRTSGPQKVEKKTMSKSGFTYPYIPSYTFMYLYIPPNSFIYLHIPPYTSKY